MSARGYRRWTITEDDNGWTAKCECGWRETRGTHYSARLAVMYHYYVCPKRFELPEVEDA